VTNLVIAAALSVAVGYGLFAAAAGTGPAVAAGAVVFLLGAAAIYLRGYLVPGTPTLTKRYFPDGVLAWFGKAEDRASGGVKFNTVSDEPVGVDVEAVLLDAGVLVERPDGDLEPIPEFHREWRAEIESLRDSESLHEAFASIVEHDADELEFEEREVTFTASVDGRRVGFWESRAAFLADVAAGRVLPAHLDDWEDLDSVARGQLLAGLRLFAEQCPACDGPAVLGQETVQSCCHEQEVVTVSCRECGARLFEIAATEEMLETP